jgi:hypothetical protein
MPTVYCWGAMGTDPRFPEGIRMYFNYEPSELEAQLTLQHLLGYQIHVADKFPLIENLRNATPTGGETRLQYVLNNDLRVQTRGFRESSIPAGTTVDFFPAWELLYSPRSDS